MNQPKRDMLSEIERMAQVARGDHPQPTDVSTAVLRRIRVEKTIINERPLMVFAMGSLAMALVVLAVTMPTMLSMMDPLNTLFETTPLALL
ncbi:MAG: hypothetical protein COA73_13085 [Candidatus Hydrogenedentota bacterium]|nr:MAG: hypothetical protein COA73_13085 [Candidatus Hydrogenedentota bacterium]